MEFITWNFSLSNSNCSRVMLRHAKVRHKFHGWIHNDIKVKSLKCLYNYESSVPKNALSLFQFGGNSNSSKAGKQLKAVFIQGSNDLTYVPLISATFWSQFTANGRLREVDKLSRKSSHVPVKYILRSTRVLPQYVSQASGASRSQNRTALYLIKIAPALSIYWSDFEDNYAGWWQQH